MAINSYRDLRVWERSMSLVERVYGVTRDFPNNELYGLTSQMRRAAVSIPSNIAEGHARGPSREFLHHLSIARGSVAELETQLEIARRLNYLAHDETQPLADELANLGRQITTLRTAIEERASIPGRRPRPAPSP